MANQPPSLSNVAASATYHENGAPVTLSGSVNVADFDNAQLASASVQITGGTFAGDGDALAASVAGTSIAASYDAASGTLTLSGPDTLAHYQQVLDSVTFASAPNPTNSGANPTRTVTWILNDGTDNSTPVPETINITANSPPALSNVAAGASYHENGAPVTLSGSVNVADTDNFLLASTKVQITGGTFAGGGDVLAATVAGTSIAASYDAASETLTLSGSDTLAHYQQVLDSVTFASAPNPTNSGANPTRTVTWILNDGAANSTPVAETINITANSPPVLSNVAASASYHEHGAPVTLSGSVNVADTDNFALQSATVQITGGTFASDGDVLAAVIAGTSITAIYDTATETLTLAGNDTLAHYQQVLDSVTFASAPNPTNFGANPTRTVTWILNDGAANSTPVAETINITANSPPALSNVAATGTYTAGAPALTLSGSVSVADPDNAQLASATVQITGVIFPGDGDVLAATVAGTSIAANYDAASETLTLSGSDTLAHYQQVLDSVTFFTTGNNRNVSIDWQLNDGSVDNNLSAIHTTVVRVGTPANNPPVNTLPASFDVEANTTAALAGMSISDPDVGVATITTTLSVGHGTLSAASAGGASVSGSGTSTLTLMGTVAAIDATLAASGNLTYHGGHDFFGADTLSMTTNDGGKTGSGFVLSDTDTATLHVGTLLTGTPGNDSFTALPGNERIDAGAGVDTISFNFRLLDATVTYSGNLVIIDGPGSHTVLSGFEIYQFTDGTVNDNDGNPLVDDLYYYSRYHDVWNAHADADQHYAQFGWHEGRNPNAFFDTKLYLEANPDVAAAGVNPLTQFDQFGWKEGRVPSLNFDPKQYLAAYQDVAAVNVDPLAHFLQFGAGEGRQPFPPQQLIAANGFDWVYYLVHNPDVAAAGVDAFLHYETIGWKEGRNPNALFDDRGYLNAYPDVKAAGVDPLDHYHIFGWKEGRDPSVNFDTTDYLAAYPDVAAAHVDPLREYLQFGQFEGRSTFADGHFG